MNEDLHNAIANLAKARQASKASMIDIEMAAQASRVARDAALAAEKVVHEIIDRMIEKVI